MCFHHSSDYDKDHPSAKPTRLAGVLGYRCHHSFGGFQIVYVVVRDRIDRNSRLPRFDAFLTQFGVLWLSRPQDNGFGITKCHLFFSITEFANINKADQLLESEGTKLSTRKTNNSV